jgi:hypothetical protein
MARLSTHQCLTLRQLIESYADARVDKQRSFNTPEEAREIFKEFESARDELNEFLNDISPARMQHHGWKLIGRPLP